MNKRIKDFGVFQTKFRHGTAFHSTVFNAVATLCQYNFENGEPLFEL